MIKSYFKLAVRNLRKHLAYSVINISGLAIGLTCFILIMLYVRDEMSYDRYHANADRIFRLSVASRSDQSVQENAQTPPIWTTIMLQEFPEVVNAVRFKPPRQKWMVNHGDRHFTEKGWAFADSTAFEVFDLPLVVGDDGTALSKPYSVVLSQAMAEKYFGDEDPMGKTLTLDNQYHFGVTGIMENMPDNSHFHYDFLASFVSLNDPQRLYLVNALETHFPFSYNYLQLQDESLAEALKAKFPDFIDQHVPDQFRRGGFEISIDLQPLTDIHLHSNLINEIEANGDITTVYIFTAVAVFILLIACINFMNLATARSSGRAKEVGLRKVVGAFRRHITQQFLGESILLALVSLVIAIVFVALTLPLFNALTGKGIGFFDSIDPGYLLMLLGIAVITGILSGSYPALFLSGFRPVEVLKGKQRSGSSGQIALRKGLIVFQFAISMILIICTGVVYQQMDYVRDKKLGINKEHVVVVQLTDPTPSSLYPAFKRAILQEPGVLSVSASLSVPAGLVNQGAVYRAGASEEDAWQVHAYFSDYDFIETLDMELAAGRDFSREFGTDTLGALIINETAAKTFGWDSPEEALNQGMQFVGNSGNPLRIIGVVRDFHSQSFREKIGPTIIGWASFRFFALVRIRPDNIPATLAAMQGHWERIIPGYTFDYSFLDDDFDKLYRMDDILGTLLGNFAMLAVFVACLGLFGLASYTANQRTKEIGVRKVLGATVPNIVMLLSMQFTKLVLIAFIIAVPLGYYFMGEWLKGFAYGIDMGIWIFLLAGALAVAIALVTVSYQAIKSALANPINSLRYE